MGLLQGVDIIVDHSFSLKRLSSTKLVFLVADYTFNRLDLSLQTLVKHFLTSLLSGIETADSRGLRCVRSV